MLSRLFEQPLESAAGMRGEALSARSGKASAKARVATSLGVGLALVCLMPSAVAIGFGTSNHAGLLGQPLSFSVPLRMDADEFVSVECVFATVAAGENRIPPSQVRVNLESAREPGADRTLRVTTTAIIDEPVVTVEVGVGCPVRLSRQFVAFVDPPTVTLAQTEAADLPRSDTAQGAAASQTGTTTALPPARATAQVRRTDSPTAQRTETRRPARPVARPSVIAAAPAASAAQPRERNERVAKVAPAPTTAPAGGPRLQLETTETPSRTGTPAAAVSAPAAAPPTALAQGAAEAAAALAATLPADARAQLRETQERERMRLLEESLARLRTDTEATRGNIATLQSRLREAESRQFHNPIVYGLAALAIVLILALIALMLLLRSRERQHAEWWAAGAQEAPPRPRAARAPVRPVQAPSAESELPAVSVLPFVAGDTQPATPTTRPASWKPTRAIPELDQGDAPKRPVNAEELMDLEQQAEFFITLGQDESAIDLLVGHLDSAGGSSPLPYLKLLEIHRRRRDQAAYDGVREQFNQRFNAYAPAFDAAPGAPGSLEEHADMMLQLQNLWPTPPRAMGLLESLLFRPGEGDTAFDLAAYREVLFLHEIARDRYEHETSGTRVDVLLPLDDGDTEPLTNPLLATMPVPPHPEVERPMVIDVDLTRPRDLEAEAAAARTERRKERYGDSDFAGIGGSGGMADDLDATRSRGGKNSR